MLMELQGCNDAVVSECRQRWNAMELFSFASTRSLCCRGYTCVSTMPLPLSPIAVARDHLTRRRQAPAILIGDERAGPTVGDACPYCHVDRIVGLCRMISARRQTPLEPLRTRSLATNAFGAACRAPIGLLLPRE